MNYILVITLLFSQLPLVYADLYQCKNNHGRMLFKDMPCSSTEKEIRKITEADVKKQATPNTEEHINQNLVKNPSFKNKLSAWDAHKNTRWEARSGKNSGAAVSIQATKPPMDKYIHETTVKQCVTLNAGTRYRLAAYFKQDNIPLKSFANRINLYWYESLDCTVGGQFGTYIEPKSRTGWQYLKADNLTPALHAKAAQINLTQKGRYSKGGRVRWDNIHLSATEFKPKPIATDRQQYTRKAGINYLTNGAFNAKLDSWQISNKTEWSSFIGNTEPGSARVTRYSSSGSNGSGAFRQCVNIGENTNFELGASFKNDKLSTAPGNGRLRISWYQDLNCKGPSKTDTNWKDPEPIDGWQNLHITGLVAPRDSQSAVIEIIQAIHEEGYFYAHWDDIYFRATQ